MHVQFGEWAPSCYFKVMPWSSVTMYDGLHSFVDFWFYWWYALTLTNYDTLCKFYIIVMSL